MFVSCLKIFACLTFSMAVFAACVATDCPAASERNGGQCVPPSPAPRDKKAADAGTADAHLADSGSAVDVSPMMDAAPPRSDANVATTTTTDAAPAIDAGPCDGGAFLECYRDADGDGYAAMNAAMKRVCADACPQGWTATEPGKNAVDCDDGDDGSHPKANELCDGVDQDCDGNIDEDADATCSLAHATPVCMDGACLISACEMGYDSCDNDPKNGCEQSLMSAQACGACGMSCDARAKCANPFATDQPPCRCNAPLTGDGASCAGAGPLATATFPDLGYVCGVTSAGAVQCFNGGPTHLPMGSVTQIAAGQRFVCGLRSDNALLIECAGDSNANGQLGTMSPNDTRGVVTATSANSSQTPSQFAFVQVVAGMFHACGLMADGRASCWGAANASGAPAIDLHQQQVPDAIQGHVTQLSAGDLHTCALLDTGEPACWGAGVENCGTSCTANSSDQGQSAVPKGLNLIQIAAGSRHTCGLKADGSVVCWGSMTAGGPSRYLRISAGTDQTCGVTSQHRVDCWGKTPVQPTNGGAGTIEQVYASTAMTCVVDINGTGTCFTKPSTATTTTDLGSGWTANN